MRGNRGHLELLLCRTANLVLATLCIALVASATAAQESSTPAERRARIFEQARPALVQVELQLKHPEDDENDGPGGLGETVSAQTLDRQQEQAIRFKLPVHLMGVIISPRAVLLPDTAIDPRRIDRWQVTDSTGRKLDARRVAMLLDAPALVLEPVDAEAKWSVPTFADASVNATSTLTLVAPRWSAAELSWSLSIATSYPVTDWSEHGSGRATSQPGSVYWMVGSLASRAAQTEGTGVSASEPVTASFNLIFSPSGDLIGVGTADRIAANRSTPPWRASDLRDAARISEREWQELCDQLREQLGRVLYPVRIEFRRPRSLPITIPESDRLAWAVDDRMLLIPGGLPRQFAAWIGKISVQTRDSEVEAELVGQLKQLDAVLIKLPDSAEPLPAHSDLTRTGTIERYRPLVAMTVNRRYGTNDLRVDYTRPMGTEYGYGGRPSPRLLPSPSIGSLVLDLDGQPLGIFLRYRRPLEELELFEQRSQGGQAQTASSVELFGLEHVAAALGDTRSAIDPRIVRRDEKDQDRRVWLGVEFTPLTRELAESLGCRKESKDGTNGLMVSQIYAGSPAEAAGLRTGDVLLWLEVSERDRPVRLIPPRGLPGRGGAEFSQFQGAPSGGAASRTPWPTQNNYLNNLLGTLGEDTRVTLSFWRDSRVHAIDVVIAQAPPDQDSAEQFKDESIGFTVKELTYEVRAALQMKPDAPGVVVSKIESGSPAGRARINPFEIIQAADSEPINSLVEFESIVRKAQQEKREQIRLTVVDRGRSRFADLKLGQ